MSSAPSETTSLYGAFVEAVAKVSPAEFRRAAVTTLYDHLLAGTTDAAWQLGDQSVHTADTHAMLLALAPQVQLLSERYGTLGGLVDAGLVRMPQQLSREEFQSQLRDWSGEQPEDQALALQWPTVVAQEPTELEDGSLGQTVRYDNGQDVTYQPNGAVVSIHAAGYPVGGQTCTSTRKFMQHNPSTGWQRSSQVTHTFSGPQVQGSFFSPLIQAQTSDGSLNFVEVPEQHLGLFNAAAMALRGVQAASAGGSWPEVASACGLSPAGD